MPSSEFMQAIVGQTDNGPMSRVLPAAALLALAACIPALNWREGPVAATGLHAAFPCKPDKAERKSEFLPGRAVVVHAHGCSAGDASFAVLYADFGQAGEMPQALAQWKQASLAAARAKAEGEQPFQPKGALALPQSVLVRSTTQRPDGTFLHSHAAYFAHGTTAFQAVVYAPAIKPELSEPFFTGLRFP